MFRYILLSIQLILLLGVYEVKSNDDCIFVGCECGNDGTEDFVICKPSDTLPRNIFPNRSSHVLTTNYNFISFENFEFNNLLPSSPLFSGLSVKQIKFINNDIEKFNKENFQDMKFLRTLEIQDKKLNVIEQMTFAPIAESLKDLRLIYGDYNSIKIMQFNENIRLLKNLQKLSLNNNKIESIDASIFSELKNLEDVDLSFNLLTSLPTNAFLNNNMLSVAGLSNNNISNLSDLL